MHAYIYTHARTRTLDRRARRDSLRAYLAYSSVPTLPPSLHLSGSNAFVSIYVYPAFARRSLKQFPASRNHSYAIVAASSCGL